MAKRRKLLTLNDSYAKYALGNPGSGIANLMRDTPQMGTPYDTSLKKMISHNAAKMSTALKLKAYEKLMDYAYKKGDKKTMGKIISETAKVVPDAWGNKKFKDITLHYNKDLPRKYGMGEMDVPLIKKAKKKVKRSLKK